MTFLTPDPRSPAPFVPGCRRGSVPRPVLCLDPSSTRTGYAVMLGEKELVCAGTLGPDKSDDPPLTRIDAMCWEAEKLLHEFHPRAVVIEMPSGKVGGRHGGAGAGLTTYGVACGAMWRMFAMISAIRKDRANPPLRHMLEVVTVDENTWTRSTRKVARQRMIAAVFAAYDAARDKGGDCSDAIGLGLWFFGRERLLAAGTKAPSHVGTKEKRSG